ncbi:hypothetical protein V500_00005 [Pseudogymnoascus sp. VKM F-4518 (FW-2643)]|nr:hypothetical protein V500_00005 [Pseudogymnoascus sp. VKM F-4518 (FW-2643)]
MDPRKYFNGKAYDGAEFMTYDTDLVFFKRFKRLNYYSLFKLQHHLSRLDADLAENVILGTANGSDEMTNEICHVLKQYNEALLLQSQLGSIPSPGPRATRTMRCFLEKMMNEVAAHELDLDREQLDTSDLVALVQADKSWGHQFVDNHQSLRGLFEKPSPNNNLMIYSEDGVRLSVRFIVPLAFSIFLMAPIVIMSFCTDNNNAKLSVLLAFVFGTSMLVCWVTKAKDWEILTVTAG